MSILNPPFRFVIYTITSLIASAAIYFLYLEQLVRDAFVIPYFLLSMIIFTIAQYITNYLLEEFIMELKGKGISAWISAPLGILFSFLTYSIISLSLGLLV